MSDSYFHPPPPITRNCSSPQRCTVGSGVELRMGRGAQLLFKALQNACKMKEASTQESSIVCSQNKLLFYFCLYTLNLQQKLE